MKINVMIIKNILLAFVLISIGYTLGKHSVTGTKNNGDSKEEDGSGTVSSYIMVYYMHSTFRCASCNKIENMTKQLINSRFKKEVKKGLIKFKDVDFQKNEKLAEQFNIVASCVVVAKIDNGKVSDFKRLDKVWTLLSNSTKFNEYIANAIMGYLVDSTSAVTK